MKFENVSIDLNAVESFTLDYLQKTRRPVSLDELYSYVKRNVILASKNNVESSIDTLITKGYDIRTIKREEEKTYSLFRYARYEEDELFRVQGDIETPFILASDFHFGSRQYSDIAFQILKDDIIEYGVKHTCLLGDILQGRGVHRVELNDLKLPRLDDQIDLAVEKLSEVNCDLHGIIGNHEEKIKGNVEVGLDAVSIVSNRLDNMTYYGSVANLMVNDKYTLMLMHGSGAVTKAVTYRIDDTWRELVNKPNILSLGHIHQQGFTRKSPDSICIQVGALQRTNSWLLQRGHTSKIGWWIVKDIPNMASIELVERCPLVY